MRRVVVVLAMVTLIGSVLSFLTGCGGSSSSSATGSAAPQPADRAQAAAEHFLDRYVDPDGRVVRRDQGGDTVGEGQAYGMLMAAAIGDQKRFNSIWTWTQKNLQRSDGLLSFLWGKGHVIDPQAASDADLDAARALLVASCRFHNSTLRQQGLALAKAIMNVEVASVGGTPVMVAGPWAITPTVTIDPSYFSPASYALIQALSHDNRWNELATSSRSITGALMTPRTPLPPDWARMEGDKPVPIGNPSNPQTPPIFGFDAVRTLVRLAEDPNPAGREIAARAWPAFAGANPAKLPVEHKLSGAPIGNTLNPVVLVAAAGAADAAGHTAARDGLLDEAAALDRRFPTYYGSAWVALGRIMLTTKLLDACTSA